MTRLRDLTNIGCYEGETWKACEEGWKQQRSNVLSGMPKKTKLLVSDLIKTHRIIAIVKPEQ